MERRYGERLNYSCMWSGIIRRAVVFSQLTFVMETHNQLVNSES